MSKTTNLGLVKPGHGTNVVEGNDPSGESNEAKNLDAIDAAIKALQDAGGGGAGGPSFFRPSIGSPFEQFLETDLNVLTMFVGPAWFLDTDNAATNPLSGLLSARPGSGAVGDLYHATDTAQYFIWNDNLQEWDLGGPKSALPASAPEGTLFVLTDLSFRVVSYRAGTWVPILDLSAKSPALVARGYNNFTGASPFTRTMYNAPGPNGARLYRVSIVRNTNAGASVSMTVGVLTLTYISIIDNSLVSVPVAVQGSNFSHNAQGDQYDASIVVWANPGNIGYSWASAISGTGQNTDIGFTVEDLGNPTASI